MKNAQGRDEGTSAEKRGKSKTERRTEGTEMHFSLKHEIVQIEIMKTKFALWKHSDFEKTKVLV